jgi:hypothetical protein
MVLKRALGCLFVLTLASGMIWAQAPQTSRTKDSGVRIAEPPSSLKLIWTNLGPTATNAYYPDYGYNVQGPSNSNGSAEQWVAVPFTPKASAHVEELQAAIGYVNGTELVEIGLYSDNAGVVGTLLASGETKKMPTFGECCTLANVSITSTAVTAGTQYWIVGSSDDTNAPDFYGAWMSSNSGFLGLDEAQGGWTTYIAPIPAAAARGTIP